MVKTYRMPDPARINLCERRDMPHVDVVLHSDYAALEARCATLTAEVMHYTAGTPHPLEARCRELQDCYDNEHICAVNARSRADAGAIRAAKLETRGDTLSTVLARTQRFIYAGAPRNPDYDSEAVLSADIRAALINPSCVHEWSAYRHGHRVCLKGCGTAEGLGTSTVERDGK